MVTKRKRTAAHDHYDIHVAPVLKEWRDDPTNVRLAKGAAVALYHEADHYWGSYSAADPTRVFGTTSAGLFRSELATRHPEYALLRDVAEAHKHMKLDRSTRVVTEAHQADVGSMGFGQGLFGAGPFGGGPSVVIKLDDGSKRHLSAVVDAVEALWATMLR
jgi:hypothetical protein